jgi:peptide/nickel transport system ATP-binding protein
MITSPALLNIEHLTVSYLTSHGILTALNDVSLTLREGRALGLAGESGSGKSTVALAIFGLLGSEAIIQKGSIVFTGKNLRELPAEDLRTIRGNRMGIVFQDPFSYLNPALTIGKQVAEPLIYHRGMRPEQAVEQAIELLGKVGIPHPAETAKAYPHQLSGGMQQRALIATAMACEPALLILDEPTTALDVTIEAQILDLLEKLRKKMRISILFISHNLGVINRLCDEICILYAGHIVEYGSAHKVFSSPNHPYTKGLMASLPRLAARRRQRRLTPIPGSLPHMIGLPEGCIFHPRCPFRETHCTAETQQLLAGPDGRFVRCWKADVVFDKPWEAAFDTTETAAQKSKSKRRDDPMVYATDIHKKFKLGGWLSSLRLERGKRIIGRIRYAPVEVPAVDGVSLTINKGEVLGLVGESGCGKTTLGRCLIRLIDPTTGRIAIDGRDIIAASTKGLRAVRQKAQIIFQNPDSSLNPRKKVVDIIGRPLTLFGLVSGQTLRRRIDELLEMVRLSPAIYANRYPHQLSGGEKQRVGIARALATSPRFIVCDEAVSALDVSVQAAILNLLDNLREELNLTYLFISHDLSVVTHLAHRVAVMYRGAFVEYGLVSEVIQPPYHPYTEALLSAVPRIGAAAENSKRIRLIGDIKSAVSIPAGCRFHPRCPRKVGVICEQTPPPLLHVSSAHAIVCHLPLETLKAVPPIM